MSHDIKYVNNSAEVKAALKKAGIRALEVCGIKAEEYAKKLCPGNNSTGNLRNSITYTVDEGEPAMYLGTAVEYGVYQELGTGKSVSGGRPGWWVYVTEGDDSKKGTGRGGIYTREQALRIFMMLKEEGLDAHMTEGNKPLPFIRPAIADHQRTYRAIIAAELKK